MSLSLDNNHALLYRKYGGTNDYILSSGAFALPVAEPVPTDPVTLASWTPVVVVQAFAPYRTRTVSFDVEKQGSPPMIPAPEDAGPHTFLEGGIRFSTPAINSDAKTSTWRVEGKYTYCETVYANADTGFVLGTPYPFNTYAQQNRLTAYPIQNTPLPALVSQCGKEVQSGYVEAERAVDFTAAIGYSYSNPTYYPTIFLHSGMVSGDVTVPQKTVKPATVY